jgi:uncharacterized membrane-anchored protein YhcB (DUF1043 family)
MTSIAIASLVVGVFLGALFSRWKWHTEGNGPWVKL